MNFLVLTPYFLQDFFVDSCSSDLPFIWFDFPCYGQCQWISVLSKRRFILGWLVSPNPNGITFKIIFSAVYCGFFGASMAIFGLHFIYRYLVASGSKHLEKFNIWKTSFFLLAPVVYGILHWKVKFKTLRAHNNVFTFRLFDLLPKAKRKSSGQYCYCTENWVNYECC